MFVLVKCKHNNKTTFPDNEVVRITQVCIDVSKQVMPMLDHFYIN